MPQVKELPPGFAPVKSVTKLPADFEPVPADKWQTDPFLRDMATVGAGLKSGTAAALGSVGGTLEATGELTGLESVGNFGARMRIRAGQVVRALPQGPSLEQVVKGEASPNDFLLSGVSTSLPSMAAVAGVAGAAALAGAPTLVAGAGAGAASYILNGGELYNGLREKGVEPQKAAMLAAGAGIPIAALDVIEPLYLAGFLKKGVIGKLAEKVASKGLVGRVAVNAAGEGLPEAGQEILAGGTEAVAGVPPGKAELAWRVAHAGTIGMVMGGAAGTIVTSPQVDASRGRFADGTDPGATPQSPTLTPDRPATSATPQPTATPQPEIVVEQPEALVTAPPPALLPETQLPPATPAPEPLVTSVPEGEIEQLADPTVSETVPEAAPPAPIIFEPLTPEAANNPLIAFGLDNTDAGSLGASLGMAVANARTSDLARARISLALQEANSMGFDREEVATTAIEAAQQLDPSLSDAEAGAAVEPFLQNLPSNVELLEAAMNRLRASFATKVVDAVDGKGPSVSGTESIEQSLREQRQAGIVQTTEQAQESVLQQTQELDSPTSQDGQELHSNPFPAAFRATKRLLARRAAVTALIPAPARRQMAIGNRIVRAVLTTRQMAWETEGTPIAPATEAMVRIKDLIDATANFVKMEGEAIVRKWQTLSAVETKDLTQFAIIAHETSIAKGSRLTPSELASLPIKLNTKQQHVYAETDQFFRDKILSLEQALKPRIAAQTGKSGASATEGQLSQILNQNFFPTIGFGKYLAWDNTNNRAYRFDTKAEQQAKVDALKSQGYNAVGDALTPAELQFAGLPYKIVKDLIKSVPIKDASKVKLERLAYRDSTHNISSYDAERAIAQFTQRMGNFIARAYYREDLNQTVDMARLIGDRELAAGRDATDYRAVETWMRTQARHILSPEMHYQAIKGILFTKFFFGVPKQAAVNLTQIPLNSLPRLSAYIHKQSPGLQVGPVSLYAGDGAARATKYLASAIKDVRGAFDYKSNSKLTLPERLFIAQLSAEGTMGDTYAATVGAIAHGAPLEELLVKARLPRDKARDAAHFVRWMNDKGLALFSVSEEFNRRVTGLAAFRAATELSDPDPTGTARRMVQETQGSYETSNLPQMAQGRKNILYLFRTYQQNQLYFYARVPGRVMGLLTLAAFAGLKGLPGEENLDDIGTMLISMYKRLTGDHASYVNPNQEIEKYFHDVFGALSSEIIMNGLSRHTDSLVDISGSLSMGRVLPTEGITKGAINAMRPEKAILSFLQETTGVGGIQGMNFLRAAVDPSDEATNWLSVALPQAVKNSLDVKRAYDAKQWQTNSGKPLVPIDLRDSFSQAEMLAKLMGFTPASVSRARDRKYAYYEERNYYTVRRELVLNTLSAALLSGKKDEKEAAWDTWKAFNKEVPAPYVWTKEKIEQSLTSRMTDRIRDAKGLPTQEEYLMLQRYAREFE